MGRLEFSVVEYPDVQAVWGLWEQSNDKTQARDIPALSKRYYGAVRKKDGEVFPFFVMSSDYDVKTKSFRLFIGGLMDDPGLEAFTIPQGIYGKVTIKPKMGFMWGLSIGEAKRAFYTEWLPKSDYVSLNMEYEYHTETSKGKNPQIDIFFAIKRRDNG
ncbi:MAG: GyrI-like domain-containing protein [Lachnospiraceae bacterium]|jgi:predicted transcriptional regulator YdeE|nr:GyrI-like domain-containing protein [Lachnospiraceae bacterium]